MSYMSSFSGNIDAIIKSITDFSGNKSLCDRLFDVRENEDTPKKPFKNSKLDIDVLRMLIICPVF